MCLEFALVIGAANGIGKENARKLAAGGKVAIADLNQQIAEPGAKELDLSGKRAIGVARGACWKKRRPRYGENLP